MSKVLSEDLDKIFGEWYIQVSKPMIKILCSICKHWFIQTQNVIYILCRLRNRVTTFVIITQNEHSFFDRKLTKIVIFVNMIFF